MLRALACGCGNIKSFHMHVYLLLQVDWGIYLRVVILAPSSSFSLPLPNSFFLRNASVQAPVSENQLFLAD